MTTIRQFKKFVDPILQADATLVYRRNAIFVTPITHILRAVAFEPTSWLTGMKVTAEIRPMIASKGDRSIGWVWTRGYWPRQNYWESDKLGFLESLHTAILVECLPPLKAAATFAQSRALFRKRFNPEYHVYHNMMLYFHLLDGQFAAVDKILNHKEGWSQRNMLRKVMPEISADIIGGCARLSRKKRKRIFEYLRQREAGTIRNFRLEKYWRPTPFPAEEKGLA